jgi:hypothetical protein
LADVLQSGSEKTFPLVNPELARKKKNYSNSGVLKVKLEVEEIHTFLEFIAGGVELNLVTAIDFTGSNGAPNLPSSLHYVDPSGYAKNEYQSAIEMGMLLGCSASTNLDTIFSWVLVLTQIVSI